MSRAGWYQHRGSPSRAPTPQPFLAPSFRWDAYKFGLQAVPASGGWESFILQRWQRCFGAVTVAVAPVGWFSHWGLVLSSSRFEAGSKVCNLKGSGRCACFAFELDDVAEP